jgi:ELWxxDGT repeat protein
LLKDIHLGADTNPSSSPRRIVSDGAKLFFVASSPATGAELYVSSGKPGTSKLLKDVPPGPRSSDPADLLVVGGQSFFTADDGSSGRELWVSDGTTAGTHLTRTSTGEARRPIHRR